MPAVKTTAAKPLKITNMPKTIGACIDLLYLTRAQRLAIEQSVAPLSEKEAAIKEHLIREFGKSQLSGARGKLATVSTTERDVPTIEDFDAIWKYAKKNDAGDLFQRRLNEAAVAARWAEGKEVPGVGKFHTVKINLTKI